MFPKMFAGGLSTNLLKSSFVLSPPDSRRCQLYLYLYLCLCLYLGTCSASRFGPKGSSRRSPAHQSHHPLRHLCRSVQVVLGFSGDLEVAVNRCSHVQPAAVPCSVLRGPGDASTKFWCGEEHGVLVLPSSQGPGAASKPDFRFWLSLGGPEGGAGRQARLYALALRLHASARHTAIAAAPSHPPTHTPSQPSIHHHHHHLMATLQQWNISKRYQNPKIFAGAAAPDPASFLSIFNLKHEHWEGLNIL